MTETVRETSPNMVRERRGNSFIKLSENSVILICNNNRIDWMISESS